MKENIAKAILVIACLALLFTVGEAQVGGGGGGGSSGGGGGGGGNFANAPAGGAANDPWASAPSSDEPPF